MGASAGGVEAFSLLLSSLPPSPSMAFVLVQHLDPTHASGLVAALARASRMPVAEAKNGLRIERNRVYVIPPNSDLSIRGDVLKLGVRKPGPQPHMSIDHFFRALAVDSGERAIGVLLSGSGSDGTEGLRAIRAEGGFTFAQDPLSARFGAMPASAIAGGVVDSTLPIERIAAEIARIGRHPARPRPDAPASRARADRDGESIPRILSLLRRSCGIDFTEYKLATILRRIDRRLALLGIASLDDYVRRLEKEDDEGKALCEDILIHVTAFFRDPEAWKVMRKKVFPKIVARHRDGTPIRVWVPGCSTGEEVYTVAIALLETLGAQADRTPIQIFGSDISATAIDTARAGFYSEALVHGLGPARIERFFAVTDGGYRVDRKIRERCVFVRHDLVRDPPFTKLDLICCRNVLIYFEPSLQKRVLPRLHYCLIDQGFLMLGRSESIGAFKSAFPAVDEKNRIYARKGRLREIPAWEPITVPAATDRSRSGGAATFPASAASDAQRRADALLLTRFAPPAVLVDEKFDIVHIRGHTADYLELPLGVANLDLLRMARDGLLPDLRSALQKARKEMAPVRREGARVRRNGEFLPVDIDVNPMTVSGGETFFLVLFEPARSRGMAAPQPIARRARAVPARPESEPRQITRLKTEMAAMSEHLHGLLDERQRMNDELTSTNEELRSTNEELQSTNEEVETAKEELQSTNEELHSLNDEAQSRNLELARANGDLLNVLGSIDIPIVILDGDAHVRRFTPRAKTLMNLIPSDIGRPIGDIRPNVGIADLDEHVGQVLESGVMREIEVRDREGHWYRMQIRPYRTIDDRLDGAVIALVDIDVLKVAVSDAEIRRDDLTTIVESVPVPLVVLDAGLEVLLANAAYGDTFGGAAGTLAGRGFLDLDRHMWNVPGVRIAVERILRDGGRCELEIGVEVPRGRKRSVSLVGTGILQPNGSRLILLTLLDVTDRATLLRSAQEARAEAEEAGRMKDVFLAMLSHELRNPLNAILGYAEMIQDDPGSQEEVRRSAEGVSRAAKIQSHLIADLLDVSAILAGKLQVSFEPVDLATVVGGAVETVRGAAKAKRIRLRVSSAPPSIVVDGDPTRLQQIVWNLLTNAVKFTPEGGRIGVAVSRQGHHARIRVSDSGPGIAPDFLPRIFDRFAQAGDSNGPSPGGLGLGLAIVRDLVRVHRGSVAAESPGHGRGAVFTVTLPLPAEKSVSRA